MRVNTDKRGKNLGARNGKKYARNVNTVKTILHKNANLLNQESLFIILKS